MKHLALGLWLALASGAAHAEEPLERTTQRGPVSVTVRLSPAAPVIGDELRLEVEALAEEGVELLMPEFGEALDRFRILDFVVRESVDEASRTRALQVYTLASPMSGRHVLSSLLVEFVDRRPGQASAPEGEDAFEVLTESLDFEVASVLPEGAVSSLPAPPGPLAPLDRGAGRLTWWVLGSVLLCLAALPFLFRLWQQRRGLARRLSAHQLAASRLDALLARPPGAVDAFWVELSGILRSYLENRFDLRAPELTTEEFFEVARSSPDLSPDLQELLHDFLEQADLVKFARHVPGETENQAAVRVVRDVLARTRDLDDAAEAAA